MARIISFRATRGLNIRNQVAKAVWVPLAKMRKNHVNKKKVDYFIIIIIIVVINNNNNK